MWASPLGFTPILSSSLWLCLSHAPLEKCWGLQGQQIHCSGGAASDHDLFDLSTRLVSNKLSSNRCYLLWLEAIWAEIVKRPSCVVYGGSESFSLHLGEFHCFMKWRQLCRGAPLNSALPLDKSQRRKAYCVLYVYCGRKGLYTSKEFL